MAAQSNHRFHLPAAALVLLLACGANAGVIGHWLFNEGAGTNAMDSSGLGNHGVIMGGASYVATPSGLLGISLDGVDDFVNFGQPALLDLTTQAFTIDAWVAINDQASGNLHGIFGKSTGSYLLGYEHGGGSAARFNADVATSQGSIHSESPVLEALPYGSYHHILLTKSNVGPGMSTDPIQLYVDGVCVSPSCDSGGRTNVISEAIDVVAGRRGGTFLDAVIDEIRVHDTRMNPTQVAVVYNTGPDPTSVTDIHPGRLNNLVTEYVDLDQAGIAATNEFDFSNHRKGWVFVSSTVAGILGAGDRAEILLQGAPADSLNLHVPGEPDTLEAMRWLPAGDYRLALQTQGAAVLDRLVVRAIPELMMWRYVAGTQLPQQVPVWDWAALKEHVLPSMNTINAIRSVVEELRPQHQAFVDEWNAEGKRWLTSSLVPAYEFGPGMTTQQAYDWWATTAGYTESDWDGIVVDEFSIGDFPNSQYTRMREALEQLTTNFPDKFFYAFAVHIMAENEPGQFMDAVIDNEGAIVWEWYEREEPSEASAQGKLNNVFSLGMQQWLNGIAGTAADMNICLGYYATPPLSLNNNPAVDYKVWMDMQFHQIATDGPFDGLRGLMEWNTKYTDEEILRWQAALYRHYGIEGRTDRLSDTLGFVYDLIHVDNPDFDQGTTGWTVTPAAGGGIGTGTYPGLGILQGRVRGNMRGTNYVYMTRSSQAPNRIVQQIEGLVPGRLYTMKMFTEDRQDYLNGISAMKTHAVQIEIDNVDIVPGREFQEVMQSERGQEVPPFSSGNQPWFNYYWRLFEAQDTTATLTISDWATDSSPGGPVGQELMFNFIEVQPYFAVGDEVEILEPRIVSFGKGDVVGQCFTGEVGKVYGLQVADQTGGPYGDTGARITGTGGMDCLLDPEHAEGFDTNRSYRVLRIP